MNFGQALESIKGGKAVARSGWNGSGQLVHLRKGNVDAKGADCVGNGVTHVHGLSIELFDFGDKGTVTRMPNFSMKTAQGASAVWTPSTTDALADDWLEV